MKTVTNKHCDDALSPAERTITAGGMGWRYLEWGEHGPPIVLWHGITSDARNWWRVGPLLAGLGFHVYAPDLPGHGYSADAPGGYRVENTARLLDEWLAALALEAPVIVGHSWGGVNALVHATLPDAQVRARALVLEDPALALGDNPDALLPNFLYGLGQPRSEAVLEEIAAANPDWHRCDVWWKAEARANVQSAAVEGFFRANVSLDTVDLLRAIDVPTLLLLGDYAYGGIWPAPAVARLDQFVSANVRYQIIPEGSHNPHRNTFDRFSMALGSFVRQFVNKPGH